MSFFFSSRRRHTRSKRDWSSDVCSSDLRSPLLDAAETLLFMPDLFHYFFTGLKVNEFTNATTSQMYDPTARSWAFDLLKSFGLPTHILGTVVQPGRVLGPLRTAIATETGVNPVPVIAPATHDTGS